MGEDLDRVRWTWDRSSTKIGRSMRDFNKIRDQFGIVANMMLEMNEQMAHNAWDEIITL